MANPGDLIGQSVASDALQNVGTGMTQGLDAGLAYAQAQRNSDLMSQQIETMKNQRDQSQSANVIGQLDKATSTLNPQLRGLYADGAAKSFQQYYGTPMNDDVLQGIKKVPEFSVGIKKLVSMYPDFAKDPAEHAQFISNFVSMFGGSLADAEKFSDSITSQYSKLKAAENTSNRIGITQEGLELRQNKASYGVMKDTQNSPAVKDSQTQMYGIDKGLKLLQSGIDNYSKNGETITWGQAHEVMSDTAQAMMAKLSAITPVARQAGLEQDIPKISQFMGRLETEFNQNPSKSVPIGTIRQLQAQLNSIRGIAKAYNIDATNRALQAGKNANLITDEQQSKTMENAAGNQPPLGTGSPQQNQQQAAPAPTNAPNQQIIQNAKKLKASGKSFNQLAPQSQQFLIQQGITPQTFDSL